MVVSPLANAVPLVGLAARALGRIGDEGARGWRPRPGCQACALGRVGDEREMRGRAGSRGAIAFLHRTPQPSPFRSRIASESLATICHVSAYLMTVQVQFAVHLPAEAADLGSHSSPAPTLPSPHQDSIRQLTLQPSRATWLPSSHCSLPSLTPLPHTASSTQVDEQPSPLTLLPSSHASAGLPLVSRSIALLPQYSQRQAELQPSPFWPFPSSHCSK